MQTVMYQFSCYLQRESLSCMTILATLKTMHHSLLFGNLWNEIANKQHKNKVICYFTPNVLRIIARNVAAGGRGQGAMPSNENTDMNLPPTGFLTTELFLCTCFLYKILTPPPAEGPGSYCLPS